MTAAKRNQVQVRIRLVHKHSHTFLPVHIIHVSANIQLIQWFLPSVLLIDAEVGVLVSETEGEAHPAAAAAAAVRLLAFRRVPSGQRSAVGLPLGLRSAGMCPRPGPAALNHPDSDILSPSPSERPLWGGVGGVGADIYEHSAQTHTYTHTHTLHWR